MVTSNKMIFDQLIFELWRHLSAYICGVGAAWVKSAGLRWIDWAWNFTWKENAYSFVSDVWDWNS